jgi:hypothetical protein
MSESDEWASDIKANVAKLVKDVVLQDMKNKWYVVRNLLTMEQKVLLNLRFAERFIELNPWCVCYQIDWSVLTNGIAWRAPKP